MISKSKHSINYKVGRVSNNIDKTARMIVRIRKETIIGVDCIGRASGVSSKRWGYDYEGIMSERSLK
jgi:hypothetical protein